MVSASSSKKQSIGILFLLVNVCGKVVLPSWLIDWYFKRYVAEQNDRLLQFLVVLENRSSSAPSLGHSVHLRNG